MANPSRKSRQPQLCENQPFNGLTKSTIDPTKSSDSGERGHGHAVFNDRPTTPTIRRLIAVPSRPDAVAALMT